MGDETRTRWSRGRVVAGVAVVAAGVMLGHSAVPNTPGRIGSLQEAFLPWTALVVPVLLVAAVIRRSMTAVCAVGLPVVAWLVLFAGQLVPDDRDGGLLVVQHNVSDTNPTAERTARQLRDTGADLIALEEVARRARSVFRRVLAERYPYHAVRGTVGLWSRHPLSGTRALDIRPSGVGGGWQRALRSTVRTPEGEVAVYVAHLPSVRLGVGGFASERRDESARLLGGLLRRERAERVLLLGDLNSTLDDRGLDPVRAQLPAAGGGFGFSWPAGFPVARIDQVLARGAEVNGLRGLGRGGSDHLPVAARVRFSR